jgi:predicted metal-dependent enzyme (double-stranded beta helix superfamily)
VLPLDLLDIVKERGPRYVEADVSPAPAHVGGRTYSLVELTDDLEIWTIRWAPGGSLELHDHGGSSGAMMVFDGELVERFATGRRALGLRSHRAGGGAAFGPAHVHAVTNVGGEPAISVHAYSPPLPGMTFYDFSSSGRLEQVRWEDRTDPTWNP